MGTSCKAYSGPLCARTACALCPGGAPKVPFHTLCLFSGCQRALPCIPHRHTSYRSLRHLSSVRNKALSFTLFPDALMLIMTHYCYCRSRSPDKERERERDKEERREKSSKKDKDKDRDRNGEQCTGSNAKKAVSSASASASSLVWCVSILEQLTGFIWAHALGQARPFVYSGLQAAKFTR